MNRIKAVSVNLVLVLLGWSFFCFAETGETPQQSMSRNLSERKNVSITLGSKTITAVVADQEKSLLEGLLGWDRITDSEGMLLDFGRPGQYAIHMKGMKFPIDAVWIDSRGEIKLIYDQIQPNSSRVYPSVYSSRYCLEIQSGFCRRYGVKEGDKIRFH